MLIRIRTDMAFDLKNRSQAEALRDAMLPVFKHCININAGEDNEEVSFIEVHECHHDEKPPQPCKIIAKWVKGQGKTI